MQCTECETHQPTLFNKMSIQTVTMFAFLVLIVCCISLNAISGKPNVAEDIHLNTIDIGIVDTYKTTLTAEPKLKHKPLKCSNYSGCNKRRCWKWCDGADSGKWCFTTKTHAQSYDFVHCTANSDCDKCWNCGGPCK